MLSSGPEHLEGQALEFKSAFTWNSRLNREDGDLRFGVVRSIAGFLNANGGRLMIGVQDDGDAGGIEDELGTLFKDNHFDRYESLIHEHLRNTLYPYDPGAYEIVFEKRGGVYLCVITVRKQRAVTYVKQKAGSGRIEHALFVRVGNRTNKLTDLERDIFVIERFGGIWHL